MKIQVKNDVLKIDFQITVLLPSLSVQRLPWNIYFFLRDLDESSCCFSGVRQMPRPLHDTKAQFYRFQYIQRADILL